LEGLRSKQSSRSDDEGLKLLLRSRPRMDVVLMDMQYAPAILSDNRIKEAELMVKLISEVAAANPPVNLFRRFDLMRRWHKLEKSGFDRMIDPADSDRLHQSDWSAQRIGRALCDHPRPRSIIMTASLFARAD
jgi:hypothetical protein